MLVGLGLITLLMRLIDGLDDILPFIALGRAGYQLTIEIASTNSIG